MVTLSPSYLETSSNYIIVKTIEFGFDKTILKTKVDTLFKSKYETGFDSLTHSAYNDTTIIRWKFNDKTKDLKNNWYNSYTYDSLSRLVRYVYTSCLFCNNAAFDYKFEYNSSGQIYKMSNAINQLNSTIFTYDNENRIQQIDYFVTSRIEERIIIEYKK
jgi:hypothetical protein